MKEPDIYRPKPLAWHGLADALAVWEQCLHDTDFWRMTLDNAKVSSRVRDAVTKAVVWLEMKGMPERAAQLDDALQTMRKAEFFCKQNMGSPVNTTRTAEEKALRRAWIASVADLHSVVQQVKSDVPPTTWEGIDG